MKINSHQLCANHNHAARLATAAALPANVYVNGTAGAGATLTATGNGALSIDGVAVVVRDVVLVKNEVAGANNGLYIVTAVGDGSHPYVLIRHPSMNAAYQFAGAAVFVMQEGTANPNTLWLCNWYTGGAVTVGTTSIIFAQI